MLQQYNIIQFITNKMAVQVVESVGEEISEFFSALFYGIVIGLILGFYLGYKFSNGTKTVLKWIGYKYDCDCVKQVTLPQTDDKKTN